MSKARVNIQRELWTAVGVAVLYVLIATVPNGPGITSDSVHYISAARSLLEHGQLRTFTGAPMVSYAPLLSWIYAIWMAFGLHPHVGAILTNAISLGVVVWVAGMWLQEIVPTRIMWIGALLAILLCRPILWYAPYALSEVPFLALVLGALWNARQYVHTGLRRFLLWAVLLSALTPLMRYIGVSVVVGVGIFLLWKLPTSRRQRFATAITYVVASLVPLVLWAVRNASVSGTFFGVREPSDYSLRQMVFETLWSWHRWVVPVAFENSVPLFGAGLMLLVGCSTVVLYRSRATILPLWRSALAVLSLFILVYGLLFGRAASTIKFEGFSERLWLPIAIPVVLIGAVVYQLAVDIRSLVGQATRLGLFIAWLGWCCSGALMAGSSIRQGWQHQLGVFSTAEWRHSALVRYLRTNIPSGKVFSNFPEPLFYLTGIVAQQTPHKGPMRVASETYPRNLPQFLQVIQQQLVRGEAVYIVWFNNPTRSHYMYALHELRDYLDLQRVAEAKDGSVFRVNSVRQR